MLLSKYHLHFRRKQLYYRKHWLLSAAKVYMTQIRSDDNFNHFYEEAVKFVNDHKLSAPELPRYKRRPARFESGGDPHVFTSPKEYYHRIYFEACDLINGELEERFSHQHTHSIILIENVLINTAANGNTYQIYLDQLKVTTYKDDVNFDDLSRHLLIIQDIINKVDVTIKKVTLIQTTYM